MNARIVMTIVRKDLREFPRNPYWVLIGPVALILIVAAYWMMPEKSPLETIEVGVHPPAMARAAGAALNAAAPSGREGASASGLKVVPFESEARLRGVVSGRIRDQETCRVAVGIAFPDGFVWRVAAGRKTTVRAYLDGSEGMADIVRSAVREVGYGLRAVARGRHPAREFPVVLPDMESATLGRQNGPNKVSAERRRTVITMCCLVFGLIVIACLTAVEIEKRTVTAILVTPAGVGDVIAAKGLTGVILGAAQAVVFLLATWNPVTNWPVAFALVLVGAVMVSTMGMIAGAAGRGFAMTLFYSILLTIPITFPVISVIRPGAVPPAMKVFPFYWLTEGMMSAVEYGGGWRDVAPYLAVALAWSAVLAAAAFGLLKRRIRTL
ncbi:MAG: ABC transporter permease [Planctomycetota bacterium]|jgi:ABC-2 type transport system permease protein